MEHNTFIYLTGLIGLLIGSFLNVIIQRSKHILLAVPNQNWPWLKALLPASHCPQCHQPVKPWHNIPVLSFLLLKGRCAYCQHAISWQYPLVETLTAIATMTVAWHGGLTIITLGFILLIYVCIALAGIDIKLGLLPNDLIYPTMVAGLALHIFGYGWLTAKESLIGAVYGYMSLWLLGNLFLSLKKHPGLGHGDMKMLAMLGAWFGPQSLPQIVVIASLSTLSVMLVHSDALKNKHGIGFGPGLALGGFAAIYLFAPPG